MKYKVCKISQLECEIAFCNSDILYVTRSAILVLVAVQRHREKT